MSATPTPEKETERRAYERTPVAIFGRCLLENSLEIPCQAINISPGDVGVIAGHTPKLGEHIIMYLDHVGRLEGEVARLYKGGFAMRINGTPRKREKLAANIEWLKSNKEFGVEDNRRHDRIVPRDTNSEIKLSDNRVYPIEIIDISLSGAAVKVDVKPAIGSHLTLAGMQGQVVRHFSEGIAIEFAKAAPLDVIEKKFSKRTL